MPSHMAERRYLYRTPLGVWMHRIQPIKIGDKKFRKRMCNGKR